MGLGKRGFTNFLIFREEGQVDNLVVDQIASNQHKEAEQLQKDSPIINKFPSVVRLIDTSTNSDNDTKYPHEDCPGNITDRPGNCIDVLSDCNTGHVECCYRKHPEDHEEQQCSIRNHFHEVCFRTFQEGHSFRVKHTGLSPKAAGDESHDD